MSSNNFLDYILSVLYFSNHLWFFIEYNKYISNTWSLPDFIIIFFCWEIKLPTFIPKRGYFNVILFEIIFSESFIVVKICNILSMNDCILSVFGHSTCYNYIIVPSHMLSMDYKTLLIFDLLDIPFWINEDKGQHLNC